ncbi:WD40 repeat domain-containing protein [Streptomyces arboris]|uniref:WD40 repeat domain-containing protein n=1 Tax=Streptomyces arboris TaxID=2600619 RepID=UPI003C3058F2
MMRWDRPAGGREPAAAALLGWLSDAQAPRLCLVSGSEGCGKSALLAWLVHHGSRPGGLAERRVHAVVPPSPDESVLATVWSVADQLGVVARAPWELVPVLAADGRRTVIVLPDVRGEAVAELVLALADVPGVRLVVESRSGSPAHRLLSGSGCAELDLDLEQWRDERRFAQWQASQPSPHEVAGVSRTGPAVDLWDPVAVCRADVSAVTAAYERARRGEYGGLGEAWLRAGQSLCRDQEPASRALTLLAALGDGADPRLASALSEAAAASAWCWEWSRVSGDLVPPWPGPVSALAVGEGPLAGAVLVTGPSGSVRVVRVGDGGARGRIAVGGFAPQSVSVMADGTVLVVDEAGRVHADGSWVARPAGSGIARLLDEGPTGREVLLAALRDRLGTAIACAAGPDLGIVAFGDAMGEVRAFGDWEGTAVLHRGRVNALAALGVPVDGERVVPLVYSGGADGTVRAWSPGHAAMAAPVAERDSAVMSIDAAMTPSGPALAVAWGDGAVEWIEVDSGARRTFRPGPPVRAVALAPDGRLLVGMDEYLVCLAPGSRAQQTPDGVRRRP